MKEERYLIKEAAALVGVETHVLRYWEEELKMDIHRNGMGHRYYTKRDVELLSKVKTLKENGLQLKAIRSYLDMRRGELALAKSEGLKADGTAKETKAQSVKESSNNASGTDRDKEQKELVSVQSKLVENEEKMQQFQQIMNRIVSNAIQENREMIGQSVGSHAADVVVNHLNGMTKEQEERAEERYRKLDQTLREIQRARQEAAATTIRPVDKRRQRRLKRNSLRSVNGREDNLTVVPDMKVVEDDVATLSENGDETV